VVCGQVSGIAVLVALACATYVLNAGFGVSVRTGLVDSSGFRWLHHALYAVTFLLALVAASSLWWSPSRAGWYLIPVLAALAVLPYIGSARRHPYRHMCAALLPLPFYILSLLAALSS
jgi:hypothetical protein